jgi:hypothetical protein
MSHTITISPQVYELLAQQARQARQSPDAIAESLLRHSLTTEMQAWRQAFETLIARVQARTARFSSEEIEADINAAADEVKVRRCTGARGRRCWGAGVPEGSHLLPRLSIQGSGFVIMLTSLPMM